MLMKASVDITTSKGTEAKRSIDEQENVATQYGMHNITTPPEIQIVNSNYNDVFILPKPQPTDDKKGNRNFRKETLRNSKFYSNERRIST